MPKTTAENSKNNVINRLLDFGYSPKDIEAKLSQAWDTVFYGPEESHKLYFEVGDDQAIIHSIDSDDVRSEGMSYGMMISVLMDKKAEFDKLWNWAHTYMKHKDGDRAGYFSWQVEPRAPFAMQDPNPAPDGEEYFVTALFWASQKWGDGEGIFNYSAEAKQILHDMVNKIPGPEQLPMWSRLHHQVVFTTDPHADAITDPSYHLPGFYQFWADSLESEEDKTYWAESARISRIFFRQCLHPHTGLSPNYANFDGSPYAASWVADHDHFGFDAFRTVMNLAMDYNWYKQDHFQKAAGERLLRFFSNQDTILNQYTLDGKPLSDATEGIPGLHAMNATAALLVDDLELAKPFVDKLWNMDIPEGKYRYYNSMLYLLALLHLSGKFDPKLL